MLKSLRRILVLLTVLVSVSAHGGGIRNYDHQNEWGGVCALQSSKAQSPIDIITPQTDEDLVEEFELPEEAEEAELFYSEHSNNTINYDIMGGIEWIVPMYGQKVQLANIHFHWSENDDSGSEHAIDGKRYASETHLVTTYKSGGLTKYVVLARLYKVGKYNSAIQMLLEKKSIDSFDLTDLYPEDISSFLSYEGSLTTPGCDETVHWIVIPEILEMSQSQIDILRSFKNADGSPMPRNVRDLQKLNDRVIISYVAKEEEDD